MAQICPLTPLAQVALRTVLAPRVCARWTAFPGLPVQATAVAAKRAVR